MDLNAVRLLLKVAEERSFTRASAVLEISQPGLSRAIARLETQLGVRLLHRSTRQVALTAEGRAFVETCAPLLAGLEEAERQLADHNIAPSGTLKLSAPSAFGRVVLLPLLAGLLQRHPQLSIETALTDRVVDLVEEGYDAALRTGPIDDLRMIALPLRPLRWIAIAAPSYLQRRGAPRHPDELASHDCLAVRSAGSGRLSPWQFMNAHGQYPVQVEARLVFDSGDPLLEAAELGAGIAQVMEFFAAPSLAAGRVQRVLTEHEGSERPLSLVYPPSRQRSARLRALIEALRANGWCQ
ncbi:LysR family transcriptional regulator [Pseudoxanthomonas sp.]|uniref:LysR family transcriptional regulator n=1 Tax=Pseudoxanthomonas sp. TaxID=1871049 RepID=UPI0026232622|nr:LysR family transcriptional regulator [Pseudoxanthomonas sp.]WDS35870.1 MAG: LysR family transcriptional regulator [Pseudoxanthomonas sp.]